MIAKCLNVLVVFLLVLIVFANKSHFITKAEEPTEDLVGRDSVPGAYIKNNDVVLRVDDTVPANEVHKRIYVFSIQPGMGSKEVSKLLYELGVTENEMAFSIYLMKNGYAKNIQSDSYEITNEMSFKEMAHLITS